jgi:hypothetical protein
MISRAASASASPAAGVKAYMEEVPVLTGISLYRLEADGNGSFQLEKPDDGEGRIVLVCLEGGTGTITLKGAADTGWRPDGQFVSLVPEGRDVGYDVHARDRWRLAALRIEAEALDHLGARRGHAADGTRRADPRAPGPPRSAPRWPPACGAPCATCSIPPMPAPC